MIGSRIGYLILFRRKNKISYERFIKSIMGKELAGLLSSTEIIAPENLWEPKGIPYYGLIYEEEYIFIK